MSESNWTWTGESLMNERERPVLCTTLLIRRLPSSHSTSASSSMALISAESSTVNSASTTQLSAPALMIDASALAPVRSDKAPSKMLLPAPVWPVMMTRPSGNVMSRESIST